MGYLGWGGAVRGLVLSPQPHKQGQGAHEARPHCCGSPWAGPRHGVEAGTEFDKAAGSQSDRFFLISPKKISSQDLGGGTAPQTAVFWAECGQIRAFCRARAPQGHVSRCPRCQQGHNSPPKGYNYPPKAIITPPGG